MDFPRYDPDDGEVHNKYKNIIIGAFAKIFIHFNVPFNAVLANIRGQWVQRAMAKLSKDAVIRVFDHLENMNNTESVTMDSNVLIKAFLNGQSEKDIWTRLRMKKTGGIIETI